MNEHLEKLLAQRKAKAEAMKRLLATAEDDNHRPLTEAEAEEYDTMDRDLDKLAADIKRAERQIEIDKELDEPQRNPLTGNSTTKRDNPSDIDVDVKRYSLLRAVNAQVTGNWDGAEYERECSIAIADNLGREAKGIFVPYTVQRAVMATTEGADFIGAGALVGTDHRDDLFIESLQADSIVIGCGAQVLTGLVGDVDIPRALGGISFAWVDEDGDSPETNSNFDSVRMSPKTITGSVPISRRLLKQSSPAVEALIQNDIRTGVALAIDAVALAGTGDLGQPKGITSTTGIATQAVADATDKVPTFEEAVGYETELAEQNALRGNPCYITTPKILGKTKTTPIDAGSGIMLNTGGEINGYKSLGTTLLPDGTTIFGNFSDVIIGMWGVMDIVVDTAAKASSGGIVLRVFQDVDIAVRHPQSFCITA